MKPPRQVVYDIKTQSWYNYNDDGTITPTCVLQEEIEEYKDLIKKRILFLSEYMNASYPKSDLWKSYKKEKKALEMELKSIIENEKKR